MVAKFFVCFGSNEKIEELTNVKNGLENQLEDITRYVSGSAASIVSLQ